MINIARQDSDASVTQAPSGDFLLTFDGHDGRPIRVALSAVTAVELLQALREREDDALEAVSSAGYAAQDVEA